MDFCIFCNSSHIYLLANGYIKCAKCKRKHSPKKIELEKNVLECFCKNYNALQTSKLLKVNYVTVYKKYFKYKEQICEYLYEKNSHIIDKEDTIYDEYTYLKSSNIYDIQNFLTFLNGDTIYNLMLPNLTKFKHYGNSKEEINKFLFLNKIAKLKSKTSKIDDFWCFLNSFLKEFKGVDKKNFIYYLKEAEFKFNYSKDEQLKILLLYNFN